LIAGFSVAATVVVVGTVAVEASAAEPAAPHLVVAAANDLSVFPPAGFVANVDAVRVQAVEQAVAAQAVAAKAAEQAAATKAAEQAAVAAKLAAAKAAAAKAAKPRVVGARALGASFSGLASWYGSETFDNRRTASGAIFHADGFTAASRTLPFGTKLQVCRGSACVLVVVTDRGPYIGGRVLDLSRGAARSLGMLGAGVSTVTATPVA
jgi:rare lipoprotein A (peptidoglycan hydrolase)